MADTETVVTEVVLRRSDLANPRFTPRELQLIREHTGRSLSELLADESSDDKFVVFAWLKLRRDGSPVGWDEMADVVLSFMMDQEPQPDPTNGQPATTSPPSAATGA